MPAYTPPPMVKQRVFNLDELSRRADPEWPRRRNFRPAYRFSKGREFIDHRDHVYQVDDMPEDEDGQP